MMQLVSISKELIRQKMKGRMANLSIPEVVLI
eukprot:CAMPEP_0168622446 /NCGR_PEP_ID=MMETSP0449_2-20121227/8275_1 /TAXON_ID=1082188 /ORGANISM="Strombidium rassoulzadegani, Strain ras09" /LENGTH=31 /DNA_ID= /DNA_START= /DNA_END= /DNA_ORIENTATION=